MRVLYSTRCCKFQAKKPHIATVERWEGAVSETSQKTCHGALLSLREVGGRKRDFFHTLRSCVLPKHLSNLKCRGYAFMEFTEKQFIMAVIAAFVGPFVQA